MSGFVDKLSGKMVGAARGVKAVTTFPKKVIGISKLIEKPTYYPELERKTKKEMWKDNFRWLCKYHELNQFYTSYGMDVKDFRGCDSYISHNDFCIMRNAGNQKNIVSKTGNYNYISLLRDKYVFASYLESTIGKKCIVESKALIENGKAFIKEKGIWTSIDELLTDGSELVYKTVDGECADGVMLVTVSGDKVTADDREYSKKAFVESIKGKRILVQDVVKQHPEICRFGTRSVNTIRIVTIKGKSGKVGIFSAMLRLSSSADCFVDNRAVGGLGVGINLDNGELMKYGFPHDAFGVKLEKHPLSNIRFEGFVLPYWSEVKELVKNAHKQFYGIQSIGWDVVITEDGPVLLEGNDDWEISGPQDTSGGLKKKWNELVNG